MIITINQKKIKEALTAVEKIVSKNFSLPILQNVVLKTENGRLKISSTNLEIGINYWIGAKIEEEGEVAVPARIFSDFIGFLSAEKVTIQTKDNIVSINGEQFKSKIIGFSAKDFPIIPKVKNASFVSLSSSKVAYLLSKVIDACSLSESRPELSGIFISFSERGIEAAATDSFRLTEQVIEEKTKTEQSIIIPRATGQELIRLLSADEEKVELTLSDSQIFFKASDWELVSRLIDGHYPDYKKVIPEKVLSRVTVNKGELEKSIRLASIFSSNIADLKLKADKEGLKILAKSHDKGEVSLQVEGKLSNESFMVSLNYRYLLDGLKVVPTDQVLIEFTGESNPLILRGENRKDFTYLIMPLRG